MNIEDWENLIAYYKGRNKDIRHLGVPQEVADQLGITLPPPLPKETDMTEEHKPMGLTWKKKKHFDGTKCGIVKCQRAADGYVCDIKPTKGNKNGQLWFGPACTKCVQKDHPTLKPMTLQELAHQRDGASDLAMVLDIEVGEAIKRLQAAGIDAYGNTGTGAAADPEPPDNDPPEEPNEPPDTSNEPPEEPNEPPPADQPQTTALAAMAEGTIQAEEVVVPVKTLNDAMLEAKEVLSFLGTFHITNQVQMDMGSKWLQEVKTKWKAVEELRKGLGKPLRDKLTEIQNYFNPPQALLLQAEGILKQKISEGNQRAQEAQRLALEAAQAAHQAGDMAATALASQQAAAADVSLSQGVSTRPLIKFAVENEAQLPGEFWSPDNNKIQAAINQGHRQIPGVRIWEEPVVSSRRAG